MSNIDLSKNQVYTFSTILGARFIESSTDHLQSTRFIRNNVVITGSMEMISPSAGGILVRHNNTGDLVARLKGSADDGQLHLFQGPTTNPDATMSGNTKGVLISAAVGALNCINTNGRFAIGTTGSESSQFECYGDGNAYGSLLELNNTTETDDSFMLRLNVYNNEPTVKAIVVKNNTLAGGGATFTVLASGAVTKASGTFRIPHPNPKLTQTKYLQHSFVESPTAGDNIYRWQVEVKDNLAVINLPDYYKWLNKNDQVWVSSFKHFGQAWGEVDPSQKKLIVHANRDGLYNVLLIGTRKDDHANEAWKGTVINQEEESINE